MKNKQFFAGVGLTLMLVAAPIAAPAQSVAQFYSGKTINILVGAGEGGAYSIYGQLAAEYLRKLLPGNPTVIVQSMPGAGRHQGDRLTSRTSRPRTAPRWECCSIWRRRRRCCSRARCATTFRNSLWSDHL